MKLQLTCPAHAAYLPSATTISVSLHVSLDLLMLMATACRLRAASVGERTREHWNETPTIRHDEVKYIYFVHKPNTRPLWGSTQPLQLLCRVHLWSRRVHSNSIFAFLPCILRCTSIRRILAVLIQVLTRQTKLLLIKRLVHIAQILWQLGTCPFTNVLIKWLVQLFLKTKQSDNMPTLQIKQNLHRQQ